MPNTTWGLPAPPGFQGLHPDLPLTHYLRHLPHWRQMGATYFFTFRLADSLPQEKLRELELLREQWRRAGGTDRRSVLHTKGRTVRRPILQAKDGTDRRSVLQLEEDFAREVMQQVEVWLDQGLGKCWLQSPSLRHIVIDALHYFDGERYELDCYVIMPNHVHGIIRPLHPSEYPLEKILQGRKLKTGIEINRALLRQGKLWQEESFDRIIRDEEHLWRCAQYIGRNPKMAGLPESRCTRWIRPSWEKCGWKFVDT